MKRIFFFIALLSLLFPSGTLFAYTSPGSPSGHVNDFTNTLSQEEKITLETTLKDYQDKYGGEIAVAVISTLYDSDIESYANTLFREWGIGQKNTNNGVLLVVAKDDHQLRIEVGYGYEGVLTDARSSEIIRNTITPFFKKQEYGIGILSGVRDIIVTLQTGDVPLTAKDTDATASMLTRIDPTTIVFVVFFIIPWFASILGRSKSWWAGGVVGAGIGGVITFFIGTTMIGILMTVLLTTLGLIFDFVVSRGYKNSIARGATPPWWSGGNFDGGVGGGFGGFGGGSSGGGGASGRW